MKNLFLVPLILFLLGEWGGAADIERLPVGTNKAPAPVLIVVQDIWGVDNFVKREAEKFSELGFWIVAVDLYAGQLPKDLPAALRLKNNLDTKESLTKIGKAFDKIVGNKRIDKTRIGILGWGIGGGLALRYALTQPQLRTLTMIYGDPIVEDASFKKIKVNRGLAVFAQDDQEISPSKIKQFKKGLAENNLLFQIEVMKGAKSGFLDSTRTNNFNPLATEETRSLVKTFLQRYLSLTDHRK